MSRIVTFYSYKGGVGRTFALANIAVLLARRKKRVLVIDWDLEAPGLHRYFKDNFKGNYPKRGIIHLLSDAAKNPEIKWEPFVSEVQIENNLSFDFIYSGDQSEDYIEKLRSFSWTNFFQNQHGGKVLDLWRTAWKQSFDFVLIDSRTGLTDAGGVCTVFLPDILVFVFSTNQQSFNRGIQIIHGVQSSRRDLSVSRPPAAILPLLGRFDGRDEVDLAESWLDRFSKELKPFYDDWLPSKFKPKQMLEITKIPYVAKFSFGEPLPVVTHSLTNPELPGFYLENNALLIESDFLAAESIIPAKQVGNIGDNWQVYGGIHFHQGNAPKTDVITLEELEHFYLKRLIEQCDNLNLMPLEETGTRSGQGAMIPISNIFTSIYLKNLHRSNDQSVAQAVLASPSAPERPIGFKKEQNSYRIQAVEAVGSLSRLVILGCPGGGKSTLINHLTTQTACLRLGEKITPDLLPGWSLEEKPLPVRILLRHFAAWIPKESREGTEELVWDYLGHQLNEWGCEKAFHAHLKHTLETSGGVIFFDGLDEVREQDETRTRSVIIEAIAAFARPLKKCRVIITCRQYAYKQGDAWCLPQELFPVVELDLFHSDQIEFFTRTWYRVVGRWRDWNDEKCAAEADNLFLAIEEFTHLKELAQYPLLLTLMAQVHGRDGYLPRDRADLYDRAVKLLLVHWDNRIVRDQDGACKIEQGLIARLGIHMDSLRNTLEQVALKAHEAQESDAERSGCADIAVEDLRQDFAEGLSIGLNQTEEIIAYVRDRAGLLQAESKKILRFPHRIFQEYLAAGAILKKGDFEMVLSERVERDLSWWQEVFLLAAGSSRGIPRNIYQLVDALLPEDIKETVMTAQSASFARLSAQAMAETEFLAHVCTEASRRPGRYVKIHKRVQGWLLAALTAETILKPKERVAAGNALNWVGDPRFDPQKWYLPKEENNGFIRIPAGEFWMGSEEEKDKEAHKSEFPRHLVQLSTYDIAKYPVTVAQYRSFAQEADHQLDDDWYRYNLYDNHPVVMVTWNDAKAYCKWLTEKLNLTDQHIELPTEARWEMAARGLDERIYPWGNDDIDPHRANYYDTGIGETGPVALFPNDLSFHGVMDMAGNVCEWVEDDWHRNYESAPKDESAWIDNPRSLHRVLRGGSWGDAAWSCRVACRDGDEPDGRGDDLGFRLVLLPGHQSKP